MSLSGHTPGYAEACWLLQWVSCQHSLYQPQATVLPYCKMTCFALFKSSAYSTFQRLSWLQTIGSYCPGPVHCAVALPQHRLCDAHSRYFSSW